MKKRSENPNDHKRKTPATKGKEADDSKFTSYDTSKKETASPQKVREGRESASEHIRREKAE